MVRELVVATRNAGKLREIRQLLAALDLRITSLADYPEFPEIIEDGKTFAANALKKARTIGRLTGTLVMGEDSGLEVRALDQQPGIYSARFAALGTDQPGNSPDEANNAKLLQLLQGIPEEKRQARYCCSVALVEGDRLIKMVEGTCEGRIATEPRGSNGFGYDPLFYVPDYGKTFGELPPEVKAQISHRAHALAGVKIAMTDYLRTIPDSPPLSAD